MRAVLHRPILVCANAQKIIDKIIPRVLDIFRFRTLVPSMHSPRFLGKFAKSILGLRHITALDTHNATFPRGKIMLVIAILLRLPWQRIIVHKIVGKGRLHAVLRFGSVVSCAAGCLRPLSSVMFAADSFGRRSKRLHPQLARSWF